jgi:hypothetical protein
MRNLAVNGLVALASVVLVLLIFEAFLVWDNRRPQLEPTRLELGGREFRFFERPEALSDLRNTAAVIGDSFTAGEACGNGRSYPSQLDRLARESGYPHRFVNLGVPGADPFMYLQVIEGLIATGRAPSAAVITLYNNDIELTCSACSYLERIRGEARFSAEDIARLEAFCAACTKTSNSPSGHHGPLRRAHSWLWKNVYLYALFRDAFVRLTMQFGWNIGFGRTVYPALWQDHAGLEFKLVEFALAGTRDALRAAGAARPLVVIYPDVQNIRRDNVYYGIYQGVERRLSRSLGMTVRSGYPAFLGGREASPSMPYSLVDDHPSCKAHEIFARWVFTGLPQPDEENALIPVRAR